MLIESVGIHCFRKTLRIDHTVHSKDTRERDQAYNDYVKQVTPTHNLIFNMVKAFLPVGSSAVSGSSF